MAIDDRRPVIVLGGTGFVGQNVCRAFTAAGHDVLVVARNPHRVTPGCRSIAMDLSDAPVELIAKVIADEDPFAVINATGGVWGVSEHEMRAAQAGVTRRLLAALTDSGCGARIIQLGSMLEYAPAPEGTSLDENAPVGPDDVHGRSKLAASEAVLQATSAGHVRGVVLRVANAAGPGAPRASLLGRTAEHLMSAVAKRETAVVELLPLRSRRDFIDVRDVADAGVLAARGDLTGLVLNIGRGEAVTVRSMVDLLIEVSGVPARVVERRPEPSALRPNRADVAWLQADTRRAAELLGWHPRRSLEDAVRAFWTEVSRPDASARPPTGR